MDLNEAGSSLWFYLLVALAAGLYSTVGQGGGSGYIAVMGIFGVSPAYMKPAALTMNIFVTTVVWWRMYQRTPFRWDLWWPLMVGSAPFAFLGGSIQLDAPAYYVLVGIALCLAATRLMVQSHPDADTVPARTGVAAAAGTALGLVSGLTGVGGGIFLSPLLGLLRWCTIRENIALSAAFVWLNSVAGLCGFLGAGQPWPTGVPRLVAAALVGTAFGSALAARHATPRVLQRLLGLVLAAAGLKLMLLR